MNISFIDVILYITYIAAMYAIEWSQKADKQLSRIDRSQQKAIVLAVDGLVNFPECKNVKHLKTHQYDYRLRVGRYRVFFEVRTRVQIIKIEEVRKRDERTY